MKTGLGLYLKHVILTALAGFCLFLFFGMVVGGNVLKYGRNHKVSSSNLDKEGPFIFFEKDSTLSIHYIEGDALKEGLSLNTKSLPTTEQTKLTAHYLLDDSSFDFDVNTNFTTPPAVYTTTEKIFVVSDIESNYGAFRDFLIANKVINQNMEWTFGKGHLVLLGDFIDRSYFTTQVLWFIYKLEQDAAKQGGMVHYILGNHELMNMQGNHSYAKSKYQNVAAVLGKKQFELYGMDSFIGRWLNSKNTIEKINDNLFVHAGLHPEMANLNMSIEAMNNQIRTHYFTPYVPLKGQDKKIELLLSSKKSPYWYRGYFKEDLSESEVVKPLQSIDAELVVVGHTVQDKVNVSNYDRVIGTDVKHPQSYYKYFPRPKSEGLLIDGKVYYRALENGELKEILKR